MKTKILLFLCIFFGLVFPFAHAGTIADSIRITGTTAPGPSGNGGILVFPASGSGVFVDTTSYKTNTGNNLSVNGYFYLDGLSTPTDLSLGWITFDIDDPTKEVIMINNLNDTFTFSGYAFSNAVGRIYFSPSNIISGDDNTKVLYTKTTGKVNGCAFSQGIGWICFDDFELDMSPPPSIVLDPSTGEMKWDNGQNIFPPSCTTPPCGPVGPDGTPLIPSDPLISRVNFMKPFETNHSKDLSGTKPSDLDQIKIEKWDSTATNTYLSGVSFTHDFRKAKTYPFTAIDSAGNTSSGIFMVVAGQPSTTLNSYDIGGSPIATTISSTYSTSILANGSGAHSVVFNLRDKYGNTIINQAGIKNVEVEVNFDNQVYKDQITNSGNKAISYSSYQFGTLSGDTGTGYSSNADYSINITSKAPTYAGYNLTDTVNELSLTGIIVKVSALNLSFTGIGEGNVPYSYASNKFKFTPILEISSLTNDKNFNLTKDIKTTFTGSITANFGGITPPNTKITHILSTGNNYKISFQDLEKTNATITTDCYGYQTSTDNTVATLVYTGSCSPTYYAPKSVIINNSNLVGMQDGFTAIPRLVVSTGGNLDIEYNSRISYQIGGDTITYNSFSTGYTNAITNTSIKVTGIAHVSDKTLSVIPQENINVIGNLDKNSIFTQIRKNVRKYSNISLTGAIGNVNYQKTNFTIDDNTFHSSIDTLIVEGGDVIVGTGIAKENGRIKTIVALKDGSGNGGNIWIKDNVQFIGAVLISDRSIISGDGVGTYYSDTQQAINQLLIKGTVVSYNTIGGASLSTPKCPFYIHSSCTINEAKRYDMNHMRAFVSGTTGNAIYFPIYGVTSKSGYTDAPVILEYDQDIQRYAPSILNSTK